MRPDRVAIRYRRLSGRVDVFRQRVLDWSEDCVVTFLESADLPKPVTAAGRTILEPGSPVIWFTYPGAWYDIGRFYLADGTFTGTYANILTPVIMEGDEWETTDLSLDVWKGADGIVTILDEDEFSEAIANGWIDGETAAIARATAKLLETEARAGVWPPREVEEWGLERVKS